MFYEIFLLRLKFLTESTLFTNYKREQMVQIKVLYQEYGGRGEYIITTMTDFGC